MKGKALTILHRKYLIKHLNFSVLAKEVDVSSNNDPLLRSLEKIGGGVQPHLKLISRVSIAVVAAFAFYFAWTGYQEKMESKAQTALFELEKKFEKQPENGKEKTAELSPKDNSEQISALKSFIGEHKGTNASIMAAMKASELIIEQDEKQGQEALNVLKSVQVAKANNLISALYTLKLSQLQVDNSQCELAVVELEKIVNNKSLDFLHPEALIRSALCHYSGGKTDEAKKLLQRVKDDYPGSVPAKSAERYLRAINVGV